MKKFFRSLASKLGYDINRLPQPQYSNAQTFDNYLSIVARATMLPRSRLVSLYDQVSYCESVGLQGSFVECGVWKGGAVGLMALALKRAGGMHRHLHLFDSFQDICEPDPSHDGNKALQEVGYRPDLEAGVIKPVKGFYDKLGGHGTLAECRLLIEGEIAYPASQLHYHVGWFQDTLPLAHDVGPIALLRLDGDWYASTLVCLNYLYDLVVPGGFIILDDYGTYDGCRKAVEEFFMERGHSPYLNRVDAGCFYFIKPAQ